MLDKHVILGIHITDRLVHVSSVQTVLTEFGGNIKTRLGLHELDTDYSSPNGLLLLEFVGEDSQCDAIMDRLSKVEGVEVKKMVFDHP